MFWREFQRRCLGSYAARAAGISRDAAIANTIAANIFECLFHDLSDTASPSHNRTRNAPKYRASTWIVVYIRIPATPTSHKGQPSIKSRGWVEPAPPKYKPMKPPVMPRRSMTTGLRRGRFLRIASN